MKHLNITVTGKVQGVFYRASTRDRAVMLGVTGWVCNRPDGRVYLEAEGSQEQLDDLLQWLQEGPPLARVEDVTVEPGSLQGFAGFAVR